MQNAKIEFSQVNDGLIEYDRKLYFANLIARRCLTWLSNIAAQVQNKKLHRWPPKLVAQVSAHLGIVATCEVCTVEEIETIWNELNKIDLYESLWNDSPIVGKIDRKAKVRLRATARSV